MCSSTNKKGHSPHNRHLICIIDTDRDKQREQQRKERAQMLPDDKEIHAGSQDLFNAPVKVKPSTEDTTSLQIRNSLGNFEPIRRLMESPGTSQPPPQPFLPGVERGYLSLNSSSSSSSAPQQHRINPSHNTVEPPSYRPIISNSSVTASSSSSLSSSSQPSLSIDSNSTKSHYQQRNLYQVNHHPTGVSNNNINPSNNSSLSSSSISVAPSIPTGPGNSSSGLSSAANNYRVSNHHHHSLVPPVSKVPHNNQLQLPHNHPQTSSSSSYSSYGLPGTVPTTHTPHHSGPVLNQTPNLFNSNSNPVKSKPIKPPSSYGFNEQSASVDVKLEGASSGLATETLNTVFNNEPFLNSSSNSVRDAKFNKNVFPNKKGPERADSQLELESILKEMTDVIPPLTAIQTPNKEINKKLPPPRRSSKSEDKIVQSIIDSGMAKIPSPVLKMESSAESSSSSESDSDSESEDSASSASHTETDKLDSLGPSSLGQTTGSPTTKWNLSSFLKTANDPPLLDKPINKEFTKFDGFGSMNSDQGALNFGTIPIDRIDNVTSTVSNKSHSPGPVEITIPSALETRAKVAARTTRGTSNSRSELHIPAKHTPPVPIPSKVSQVVPQKKDKVSSLSASSSDDEEVEPVKQPKRKSPTKPTLVEEKKPSNSGATTAKRPRQSGKASSDRNAKQSDCESSPENKGKGSKNGQDKNKTDTLRKLFRLGKGSGKVQSPSLESEPIIKPHAPTGTSKQASNRVSAKGNPSATHNGDLLISANISDKKKEVSKEKAYSQAHNKKHQKLPPGHTLAKSSLSSPETATSVPCPPAPRVKEETSKAISSPSSLIVRIPLDKLRRKPPLAASFPALAPIVSPSLSRSEKEQEKANKAAKLAASQTDIYSRIPKVSQNSSRVGSSSDPTVIQPFSTHNPVIAHNRDDKMCSGFERLSPMNHPNKKRPKKRSRTSPKKTKPKREPPDSHTKLEGDTTDGEVSSANVLNYPLCDSITRTPPIDPDIVQAPDSSLNPPHLPSPFVAPQLQYFSPFEKNEIKDDLFSRDQDSYLEEAKKLKHSADHERTITTQASMYLEAGLYFILTGIIMERDNTGNSNTSYTMYRDTLTLIQYIGNRWRSSRTSSAPPELHLQEAKIITLSMRCQALLFCKLFKMKMRETREMVSSMHEYFTKTSGGREPIVSSPQLSTPSPRSPTSSPAGSSTIVSQHTPSPHHQSASLLPIPRTLYNQMQKQCGNAFNCIMAHDTWEQADVYVVRYRLEDFFIGIDRQLGPLTLHSTLVDLVRYVRHGLQLINGS